MTQNDRPDLKLIDELESVSEHLLIGKIQDIFKLGYVVEVIPHYISERSSNAKYRVLIYKEVRPYAK